MIYRNQKMVTHINSFGSITDYRLTKTHGVCDMEKIFHQVSSANSHHWPAFHYSSSKNYFSWKPAGAIILKKYY